MGGQYYWLVWNALYNISVTWMTTSGYNNYNRHVEEMIFEVTEIEDNMEGKRGNRGYGR